MKFSKNLTNWFSDNKRDLPWRKTKNPYFIWLSEIILQQTQIKQGLPYYEAFVEEFPTVFDLAKADENKVLKLWQGLGYYSRARNLHATSKYISDEHKGQFPKTYDELLKLKGVGDYTASAIGSICFDLPTAVVDGNVYRVLSRYFDIETPINSSKGVKEFKALASELLDVTNPGDHNQAIMEFGAKQCKPKNPNCHDCPLNQSCLALKNKTVEIRPVKLKKIKVKKKHFNFLVFVSSDNKTLFEKRTQKGIWQNLYQFPLVETESKLISLSSEHLKEVVKTNDYSIELYNEEPIIHKLSHQHLNVKFWIIRLNKLPDNSISISNLRDFPTSILISNFIDNYDFR